ncbi:hypothetical protein JTE90_010384 [Oedothorax gibbosus]|uniref:Uncharacterized protein n=1 Tax=Oedothorax gibbosus TaxID=931172 RepID=A0AAV6W2E1_9ARAC|nr:hypothetical protein JTE90_010384 [Oedothorax gibbosus]
MTTVIIRSSHRIFQNIIIGKRFNAPSLHPRTFHLSHNQEFEVISKVICAGLPCPEYNIVQDYPYFIQQRSYRSATFLKLTAAMNCHFNQTLEEGGRRMASYLKGNNSREHLYSATLPFLVSMEYSSGIQTSNPWCVMSYSANLYTPHFWGILAAPTQFPQAFERLPEDMQVYVHTFDGAIETVLLREIDLFRRNLDTIGLCYKKIKFYVAIYDVPHNPGDSRNELWFAKCKR